MCWSGSSKGGSGLSFDLFVLVSLFVVWFGVVLVLLFIVVFELLFVVLFKVVRFVLIGILVV